jgi:hypothetical protein
VLESFVMIFAALIAKDLSAVSSAAALAGGAALALTCLLAAGLVRRGRVGLVVGWFLQAVMIATGAVVPMMFGIGLLFAALWAFGLYSGARVERERRLS